MDDTGRLESMHKIDKAPTTNNLTMSTCKSDHTEEKNICARLQYLLPDDLDVGTPYGISERLKSEHPPIFLCGLQVAEIKSAGRRFSPNLTSCTLAYIC